MQTFPGTLRYAITAALLAAAPAVAIAAAPPLTGTASYIVEARTTAASVAAVRAAGGIVTRELPIIHGTAARMTTAQATRLARDASVQVQPDRVLSFAKHATSATNSPPLAYSAHSPAPPVATEIDATPLHTAGTTGKGVTIAMIDTGFTAYATPYDYDNWGTRVLTTVDFATTNGGSTVTDLYGHGTQTMSVAGSAAKDTSGNYYGIAPGANFVVVRVGTAAGTATYATVIAGIDWVIANKAKYNIRVVNLSLGAPPTSFYWNDALDQAVMQAWSAGLVVVAAAGNDGPAAQTVGVPGNVPYVITVGAFTDAKNPNANHQGALASFSSTGPTLEGFLKPEVVAPGGHVLASMPNDQSASVTLATEIFGDPVNPLTLFPLSGTSQATAVTSGVIALLLQKEPSLTPDQVKCKLMASARPAVTNKGVLAYSVFQQGAGLIDALGATATSATGCANQGLNLAADLANTAHFGGPANQNAAGSYYVMAMSGSNPAAAVSTDGYTWLPAAWPSKPPNYAWSDSYVWAHPYSWSIAFPWQGASAAPAAVAGAALSPTSNAWAGSKGKGGTTKAASVVVPYPAQEE